MLVTCFGKNLSAPHTMPISKAKIIAVIGSSRQLLQLG
jgi:hypothetical protein